LADRVTFTRPAAERIGKVVRIVEAGDREAAPYAVDVRLESQGAKIRLGSFTGSWDSHTFKVVTVTSGTATATTEVFNWTSSVVAPTNNTTCARYVIFTKVSGTASLLEVEFQPTCETCLLSFGGVDLTALPGYAGGSIQLLGHTESACMQWYSITTCATATASV
jgi:hypothetical protein